MKATVGDRIVIASNRLDGPVRDGEIVGIRNLDGTPPYLVEWSDTGEQVFFFPGPDAHLRHFSGSTSVADTPAGDNPGRWEPATSAGPDVPRHVKSWRVDLDLFEAGDDTTAQAVLIADGPGVATRGSSHRNPKDKAVPEIGDEVAVARALRRLSDRLLGIASDDISELEGRPVDLAR